MADYTIELRHIVESNLGNELGLDDYPIFDELYRDTLNMKIINHYWYNEIAHETIDQFVRRMRTKMWEIMPFYNKLYESELVKIDPLTTTDITVTGDSSHHTKAHGHHEGNGSTTTKNESTSNSDTKTKSRSRAVNSDFPQVRLAGDEDYASNGADSVSDVTSNASAKNTDTGATGTSSASTDSRTQDDSAHNKTRTKGYNGSPAQLLQAWRETFLNIDLMVIQELQPLFMQLWSSGDQYTRNEVY